MLGRQGLKNVDRFKKAKNYVDRFQSVRYGMYIVKTLDFMRFLSSSESIKLPDFLDMVYAEQKKQNKHKLDLKSMRAMMHFLHSMWLVDYDYKSENLRMLTTYDELETNILSHIHESSIDRDLMGDYEYLCDAYYGRLDAKEFSKRMKGTRKFEQKEQDRILPNLIRDIKEQWDVLRKDHNFKGKLYILDVGCGLGFLTAALAKELKDCAIIVGYDTNSEVIMEAKKNKPEHLSNLSYTDKGHFTSGQFHMVISINVLHDVTKPGAFLQDINSWMHPLGRVLIADPLVSNVSEDNILDMVATVAMSFGCIGCVLSTECDCAMGPAIGKQVLKTYIEENDFRIRGQKKLGDSGFYHCFIAEKGKADKEFKFNVKDCK